MQSLDKLKVNKIEDNVIKIRKSVTSTNKNLTTYYMFGEDFREMLGYLMNIYIVVIVAFVGWNFVKDTQQVIYWRRHNMERGEYFDNSTQY